MKATSRRRRVRRATRAAAKQRATQRGRQPGRQRDLRGEGPRHVQVKGHLFIKGGVFTTFNQFEKARRARVATTQRGRQHVGGRHQQVQRQDEQHELRQGGDSGSNGSVKVNRRSAVRSHRQVGRRAGSGALHDRGQVHLKGGSCRVPEEEEGGGEEEIFREYRAQ